MIMNGTPLFIDRPSGFEKVAVTVKLPDDVSKWAPRVLSELHRQSPAMRDFHSEIVLDRTEPNKGMGFGYAIARPKTANPLAAQSLPSIKIPVFIKNWHLSPIDVFFTGDGRGYHLSERRIREVLTRPDLVAGGVTKGDPVSDNIRNMLTPPWENVGQFYRGINTNVSQGAQVKTSSLLSAIDGTVSYKDSEKLASWVRSDEGKASLWGHEEAVPVMARALRLERADDLGAEKVAAPTGERVIQYRWDGGPTMQVKIAQPGGFQPQQGQVSTQDATQQMTPDAQQQVAQQGQATQAPPMAVMTPEEMDGDDFKPVDQFGIYRVITVNNEQLMGWVFPFILSFKMEKVPQQIFTDGSNFATQQSIAGVQVATNANLPNEQPQGRGFFYIIRNGRAFAFAPLDLQGEQQQPDGNVMYMGQTLLGGNPAQIMKIEGMNAASEMGEGQFAIPGDVKWCSFKQQTNPLIEDPMQAGQRAGAYTLQKVQQKAALQQQAQQAEAEKASKGKGQKKTASLSTAEALQLNNLEASRSHGGVRKQASAPITAVIRVTQDNTYTLGGNAFNKLAHAHTHFLDYADAEWMLALAGVSPDHTREKLAHVHPLHKGRVEIPVIRPVTPPERTQIKTASLTKVCGRLSRFMAKHASELRDPNIADTLLALNFLNPRNVSMFISYTPTLEEATSQVANLLVASRLGESSIDEGACVEALRNLEDVLAGLKMLSMSRETV
jgi:hypothetical protein